MHAKLVCGNLKWEWNKKKPKRRRFVIAFRALCGASFFFLFFPFTEFSAISHGLHFGIFLNVSTFSTVIFIKLYESNENWRDGKKHTERKSVHIINNSPETHNINYICWQILCDSYVMKRIFGAINSRKVIPLF